MVATAGTKIMSRPARVDVTGHTNPLAKVRPASSRRLRREHDLPLSLRSRLTEVVRSPDRCARVARRPGQNPPAKCSARR